MHRPTGAATARQLPAQMMRFHVLRHVLLLLRLLRSGYCKKGRLWTVEHAAEAAVGARSTRQWLLPPQPQPPQARVLPRRHDSCACCHRAANPLLAARPRHRTRHEARSEGRAASDGIEADTPPPTTTTWVWRASLCGARANNTPPVGVRLMNLKAPSRGGAQAASFESCSCPRFLFVGLWRLAVLSS